MSILFSSLLCFTQCMAGTAVGAFGESAAPRAVSASRDVTDIATALGRLTTATRASTKTPTISSALVLLVKVIQCCCVKYTGPTYDFYIVNTMTWILIGINPD